MKYLSALFYILNINYGINHMEINKIPHKNNRQKDILDMFEDLTVENNFKKSLDKDLFFNKLAKINNFNSKQNLIFFEILLLIFVIATCLLSIYKGNTFRYKHTIITLLQSIILMNLIFFFEDIYNKNFTLTNVIYHILLVSLIIPILIIIDISFYGFKHLNENNSNDTFIDFHILMINITLITIGNILYWRFFTYPKNNEFYINNKHKLEKFKGYIITKKDKFNNKYVTYIDPSKENGFIENVLSM